jgi:hypothetical protein
MMMRSPPGDKHSGVRGSAQPFSRIGPM